MMPTGGFSNFKAVSDTSSSLIFDVGRFGKMFFHSGFFVGLEM
jgi:hypothetical protein